MAKPTPPPRPAIATSSHTEPRSRHPRCPDAETSVETRRRSAGRCGGRRGDHVRAIWALKVAAGLALIVVAFAEELATPDMAVQFLADHPELNVAQQLGIGMSDLEFARLAGGIEVLFGLLLISCALPAGHRPGRRHPVQRHAVVLRAQRADGPSADLRRHARCCSSTLLGPAVAPRRLRPAAARPHPRSAPQSHRDAEAGGEPPSYTGLMARGHADGDECRPQRPPCEARGRARTMLEMPRCGAPEPWSSASPPPPWRSRARSPSSPRRRSRGTSAPRSGPRVADAAAPATPAAAR